MSIPKEPRQLMINIMYLVLTALLALNVSAEVLKAFDRVDKGMKNANNVVDGSNEIIQGAIVKASETDERALALVEKAQQARKYSEEFCSYVDDVRQEIIVASGDWVMKDGKKVKLKGAKDVESTTKYFVNDAKGDELKGKIEEYRKKFLDLVKDDPEGTATLSKTMTLGKGVVDFVAPPDHPNYDWKTSTFQKVPVAAVMPILTSFEADAKRAESELLNYFKSKIGATDYKFDKLSAKVVAETKYLVTGKDYNAKIFLSATSSQAGAEVYTGSFTSAVKKEADGTYPPLEGLKESEMPLKGAAPLEMKGGEGIFTTKASGSRKITGVIKVMSPKDPALFDFYPFEMEYETFNPGDVVISPTAMNVLYIGVDNPISITAGNANPSTVSASGCGISKASGPGKYVARPSTPGRETITVNGKSNEGDPVNGSMEFRIMRVPDPYMYVAGKKTGALKKGTLAAQAGMFAKNDDFVFELNYKLVSFEMIYAPRSGNVISTKANSNRFTPEQKTIFSRVKAGDRLFFSNVRVKMPDGTTRSLGANFTII